MPSITSGATTVDSLFGPLPTVETRGMVWLFVNKQLKPVRLRLGTSDGSNIEVVSVMAARGTSCRWARKS